MIVGGPQKPTKNARKAARMWSAMVFFALPESPARIAHSNVVGDGLYRPCLPAGAGAVMGRSGDDLLRDPPAPPAAAGKVGRRGSRAGAGISRQIRPDAIPRSGPISRCDPIPRCGPMARSGPISRYDETASSETRPRWLASPPAPASARRLPFAGSFVWFPPRAFFVRNGQALDRPSIGPR